WYNGPLAARGAAPSGSLGGSMNPGDARPGSDGGAPIRTFRRTGIRHFDRQLPPDRGPRLNEQIRISPVRLVGAGGEQLGIVPTAQALEKAREAGLDLVEVAATERPPVCKILDYGKLRFADSQKQRNKAGTVRRQT